MSGRHGIAPGRSSSRKEPHDDEPRVNSTTPRVVLWVLAVCAARYPHVAVFCAALGVVLGAATIGPLDVLVVLPSMSAATALGLFVALAGTRAVHREQEPESRADRAQ